MSRRAKEFNKKSQALKEFYDILDAKPPKLSTAEKKELKRNLKRLEKLRKRDPRFEKAMQAFIEAEAKYGKEDPCEGRVVILDRTATEAASHVAQDVTKIENKNERNAPADGTIIAQKPKSPKSRSLK